MKFLMMFALCVAVVRTEMDPVLKEQLTEVFMAVAIDCVAKENSNFEEVMKFMDGKVPTTREAKCLLSCFFQHTHMQTPDGKMNVDGVRAATEFFKDNQYLYEAMGEVGKICIAETKSLTDRCDVAGTFAECTNRPIGGATGSQFHIFK